MGQFGMMDRRSNKVYETRNSNDKNLNFVKEI